MATTAATNTDQLPRLMDGRCMVISQQVHAAMPARVPAVVVAFIALRWYTPEDQRRSHVAIYLSEGGGTFVVDASWQQYPFVAKMQKYSASTRRKHRALPLSGRDRASGKAAQAGDRVYVGTPDEWQAFIESFNTIGAGRITRRVFLQQADAAAWMSFEV
ncbi:hypothetical protein D621_17165 [beta proteobacterium AAP51]|nr:hypothetical protein D621_17165 [beta proteobacterium AAP51]